MQAEEGDEIDVEFLEEADGAAQCHVIRESWKPRARTPLSEFEHLLPELPEDGADEATMAAYHQALRHAVGKG